MVFCYQNCSDLLWEKNCSSDQENLLKFEAEVLQHFEITRTIYSNSEWSEQFLVTECFFNLFLEVSQICNRLEQLEFKLEKIIGI